MGGNRIPQLRTHVQRQTEAPLEGWESYFFQRGCLWPKRRLERGWRSWMSSC